MPWVIVKKTEPAGIVIPNNTNIDKLKDIAKKFHIQPYVVELPDEGISVINNIFEVRNI